MPLRYDFFPSRVLAFTTDRTVDFRVEGGHFGLTLTQKKFLSSSLGRETPEPIAISQVHSDGILIVPSADGPLSGKTPEADAAITQARGVLLGVRTADCLPVFIFDPARRVIGLAHAGWKGSFLNISGKMVGAMAALAGSDPVNFMALLGPAIRPCCYAVGEEFKARFPREASVRDGQTFLDLPGVNRRELIEAGMCPEKIADCAACTCCGSDFYSYRREGGSAGRMFSGMMIL